MLKIRIDPLDKLFSQYIRLRANGVCQNCGKPVGFKKLQCSHFWGRAAKSVRWDIDNAVALCFTCHRRFTEYPHEHVAWFRSHLGEEKYDDLLKRALKMHPKPDKEAIKTYLNMKLKELG